MVGAVQVGCPFAQNPSPSLQAPSPNHQGFAERGTDASYPLSGAAWSHLGRRAKTATSPLGRTAARRLGDRQLRATHDVVSSARLVAGACARCQPLPKRFKNHRRESVYCPFLDRFKGKPKMNYQYHFGGSNPLDTYPYPTTNFWVCCSNPKGH